MLSPDLVVELQSLPRVEKLQVIQMLSDELAAEDMAFEIATPYCNEKAAEILFNALKSPM